MAEPERVWPGDLYPGHRAWCAVRVHNPCSCEWRALTLDEPEASLVAVGLKWLETRSWATRYRGRLAIHAGLTDRGARRDSHRWDALWGAVGRRYVPARGAIVATCVLEDVARIGGPSSFRTGIVEGDEGDEPGRPVVVHHPPVLSLDEALLLDRPGEAPLDVTDQLPYGDFSPGRYALILRDVEPVDPPVRRPRGEWHRGVWRLPADWREAAGG